MSFTNKGISVKSSLRFISRYTNLFNKASYETNLGLLTNALVIDGVVSIPKPDQNIISSSFVGIFWFTDDYSDVVDIAGIQDFTKGDILAKNSVSPTCGHIDHSDNTHHSPRGRVSVYDGKVIISVGTECPDFALQKVCDVFGLNEYKGNKLQIFKDTHWDVEGY